MSIHTPTNRAGEKGWFPQGLFNWQNSTNGLYLAMGVSLVIKVTIALSTKVINPDGTIYINAARAFNAGHYREALALFSMPLYPLSITFMHLFIPQWVMAARVVSIIVSVFTLFPLYLLTKKLFDRKAAFWACTAFALSPLPNSWAVEVIRDPSFLFFFAWTVFFSVCAMDSRSPVFFILTALGTLISISYRMEGVVFIPIFLFFLSYLLVSTKQYKGAILKGVLIFILIPLCAYIMLFAIGGSKWSSFNNTFSIIARMQYLLMAKSASNYMILYKYMTSMKNTYPILHGGYLLETVIRSMPSIYIFGMLYSMISIINVYMCIPLAIGLKHTYKYNKFSVYSVYIITIFIIYFIVNYYLVLTMDYHSTRYMLLCVFMLYPWMGRGVEYILNVNYRIFNIIPVASMFLVMFWLLPPAQCLKSLWGQDAVVRVAGEWLATQPELQKLRWATTDNRIPFYAGRGEDDLLYRGTDYPALAQLAATNGIDVIIIRISSKRKDTVPTLPDFEKVKEFEGRKNIAVLYLRKVADK
jgi:hypothetical protein